MAFLPAAVVGCWFHLYLILDLYSHKIVGWEVHDPDSADHAAHLVYCAVAGKRIVILHQFVKKTQKTPPKELAIARRKMQGVRDDEHA